MSIYHQTKRMQPELVELATGYKAWHVNDVYHRVDGPAIECPNGTKEWWVNGNKLTEDEWLYDYYPIKNKSIVAYEQYEDYNGELHHLFKPAITKKNSQEWFKHGKRHRIGGPAIKGTSNGVEYEYWYEEGKLHRDGGPAATQSDGYEVWYKEGEIHREGGPAITKANGNKSWWQNNELHRIDGPAVEDANGNVEYYLNGINHSKEQWLHHITQLAARQVYNED